MHKIIKSKILSFFKEVYHGTLPRVEFSIENISRHDILKDIGLSDEYSLIIGQQIHSDNIFIDTQQKKLDTLQILQNTDAIITNIHRTVISVYTSDCVPIFIFDKSRKVISIVHSGCWGTEKKIILKVIHKMISEFNSKKKDLLFYIGPSIRQCCYYAKNEKQEKEFKKYFSNYLVFRNNRYYLDLPKVIENDIFSSGIPRENVENSSICVSCDSNFSSHQREGKKKTTSNINFIMLK